MVKKVKYVGVIFNECLNITQCTSVFAELVVRAPYSILVYPLKNVSVGYNTFTKILKQQ